MNDDELRARLEAADPARHDVPVASWIDELVEATVSGTEQETAKRRNGWVLGAAAAAVVAALGVGGYAVLADDDSGGSDEPKTTLALQMAPSEVIGMCIELSADSLALAEQAFAATATEVGDGTVTLETDHWYKGGDADLVTLAAGDEAVMLEGGITFAEGERYLVSASAGTVGVCGTSGPYTEELAALYAEAFGG